MENNKVTQTRCLHGNGAKNLIASRKCDVLKHPQVHGLLQYSLWCADGRIPQGGYGYVTTVM